MQLAASCNPQTSKRACRGHHVQHQQHARRWPPVGFDTAVRSRLRPTSTAHQSAGRKTAAQALHSAYSGSRVTLHAVVVLSLHNFTLQQ